MISTVIDVAGHPTGGAARWRNEAERWIARHEDQEVELIGTSRRVEARWLVRRELHGCGLRRIAANNVSFVTGSGPRIVLLRNALHFLRPGESSDLPAIPSGIRSQTPIVHAAARRAHRIVVPSSSMGDRIASMIPTVAARIVVRHHPLTPNVSRRPSSDAPFILFSSIPSPHKDLAGSLTDLVNALEYGGAPLVVKVTATKNDLGPCASSPLVVPVGTQTLAGMDQLLQAASATYLPSQTESFGYPVAEGRAIGLPVIAVDTEQNREVGGGALFGYIDGDRESLAQAILTATQAVVTPDPQPFDADAYFSWLTDLE